MKSVFRKVMRKFVNLDRITASFTKAIVALQRLQEQNKENILDNLKEVDRLNAESTDLMEEAEKAARFQKNLETLMGG